MKRNENTVPGPVHNADFLAGGGELSERIRLFDWSNTPLGPIEDWPQSLKTSVSLMLNSRHPMWIGWGPDATFLYNDAYIQVLSMAKHPHALGKPAAEVWAEIWDICGPLAEKVFQKGEASFLDDVRLFMSRGDFLEETFYSFSYSPIRDESGNVGGLFCPSADVTPKVLNARRLRTLSEFAAKSLVEKSTEAACASATTILAGNRDDIPFVLLYLIDVESKSARLEQAAHISTKHVLITPHLVNLDGAVEPGLWPMAEVLNTAKSRVVSVKEIDGFPLGAAQLPVSEAVVLPVTSAGHDQPVGILIAGVNPARRLDTEYRTFYELVAGHIATAIQNARAAEEEKRRADMLAELDRAKTTFFSNVSHEFRTPLTLMLGPMEDILRKPEAEVHPEHRALTAVAHRNGLRLLKLVNTLLDFSRIEAGRTQAAFTETDLAAETAGLAALFRSAMERAGLTFTVDCPSLPQSVFVDRDMWEKIVFNLLSNAFKFTHAGEVNVSVHAEEREAVLSVRDTGIGIPREEIPDIFKRFHRIENARGRTHEGTGIGLALAQELVKLHGGTMEVKSELGSGSMFIVRIPFGKKHLPAGHIATDRTKASTALRGAAFVEEALSWLSEGAPPNVARSFVNIEESPSGASGETSDFPLQRILLAEDNADMRDYVCRLLRSRYTVEAVPNGAAALEAARQNPPDLVLSDVMMPVMNGFEVVQEFRADERLRSIPIILLSARAGEEARVEGVSQGADDYLTKPFSARELLARVGMHLEMARVRREASANLRQQAELLHAALTASDTGTFRWDPRTGAFLGLDQNFKRLFGFAPDEPLRHVEDVVARVHPDDISGVAAAVEACAHGSDFDMEFRVVLPDGGIRWLYDRARTMPNEEGQPRYVVGAITDITGRKRAEEAVHESAERVRFMFESMPQKIFTANFNGEVDYFNRQWMEFTGLTFEQIRDWGWTQFIHPDDVEENVRLWRNALSSGEPFTFIHRFRRFDGMYRWHLSRAHAMRNADGKISMWIGSNSEIHEQKEVEDELRRANTDLEQFAYSASHDLQEPIRNVAVYGEILNRRYGHTLDDRGKEYLGFMTSGARRMEMLVKDLLAYTQSAKVEDDTVPEIDSTVALEKALSNLSETMRETGAEVSHNGLPKVRIREVQMQQLFQNLIGNAVKYRQDAVAPRIEVGASRNGDEWLFSVKDNGIGVPHEYKERIFGIFKRLHSDRKYSGTGIGLAICQRIVERNGGRIWVESDGADEGSTFYFTLPSRGSR